MAQVRVPRGVALGGRERGWGTPGDGGGRDSVGELEGVGRERVLRDVVRLKVTLTGLTQNSQVDPAVGLKIPIRALEWTHILGQPCEFQVPGRATLANRRP